MQLKETDLKKVIKKIKANEEYNNISSLLSNVLNNCYYSKELFYTIEYTDIIVNDDKKNNTFNQNMEQDLLKMLLYILKNKNANFDKTFFDIILELVKIDQGLIYDNKIFRLDSDYNRKIDAYEYNKLLFFLSIDYSNSFIRESEDQLFNVTLNQNFEDCFNNLLDTFSYYEESNVIFKKLDKYSPIICNIILKNSDYIKNLEEKKLNNSNIIIEYTLFNILIGVFTSNIKELNYNYQIISEAMEEIMDFVNKNFFNIFNDKTQISVQNMNDLKQLMFNILCELSSKKVRVLN